jgi:putative restriction endonuclease
LNTQLDSSSKYGSPWSRDELILALYLYCQIPFSKTKANNPEVIRLASVLGRTPSSVARKLGNFGAFDPLLATQGISGLQHYSREDRAVWEEYSSRWDDLVEQATLLMEGRAPTLTPSTLDTEPVISLPTGPTTDVRAVTVRLKQAFFRRAVLASYLSQCCMCDVDIPRLLVASHIVPWSANESARTDPSNGLCLCALHDRAFDCGLLCVSQSMTVTVAKALRNSQSETVRSVLLASDRRTIRMPTRFAPGKDYLQWHCEQVFQG